MTLATVSYKFSVPLNLAPDLSVQKPYFFSLVNFDNVYNNPLKLKLQNLKEKNFNILYFLLYIIKSTS